MNTNKTVKFGETIRQLRREVGYTLNVAGEKLGVAGNTLGGWERMSREPNLREIMEIARLYRVDINTLFEYDEVSSPTAKLDVISQTIYSNEEMMNLFKSTEGLSSENMKTLVAVAEQMKN